MPRGRRHPHIAGEGQLEPATQTDAVDDGGGGETGGEPGQQGLPTVAEGGNLRRGPAAEFLQPGNVDAREEAARAS